MRTKDRLIFLCTMILSVTGVIIQSLALNGAYEADKRLYISGPLTVMLAILTGIGSVLCLVSLFILKKKEGDELPGRNYGVLFFGLLAALFCLDDAVFAAIGGSTDVLATSQENFVSIGALVMAVPFIAYFAYTAFVKKPNYVASTLLGIGACAYGICKALTLYFDMSYALSSGARIYNIVTTLVMVLFLICECRYHAAEGRRGQYFACAFALIFFACIFSVPMMIYSFSQSIGFEIELLCIQTAVGGYAISRLFSFSKISEEEKMTYTFKHYEKLGDVNWDEVPKAMVDKYGWGYEYAPLCYARGVYAEDTGLVVKLTCHEENPRATLTEFMDDVCNDSCMEFFFAGDDPEDYANLEFNALGTQHTSLRKGEEKGSIDKFTEIPNAEAKIYDDRWELTLTLTPKNVFDITGKELARGAVFHGNFYKCGDQCEQLHYGMWSEVKTEKPSFHQPQFFGELIVE